MNAIIFDLDETLYRRRRWMLSGFSAVSRHLEVAQRLERGEGFRFLVGAMRAGRGQEAFQLLCDRFGLPRELIPGFVRLMRSHKPRLNLCASTRRVLADLRSSWRLGILTNGPPSIQARKIDALGLPRLVDSVVYAEDHGTGKPEPRPFFEIATRVGVTPSRCVFVGDDLWRDVHGARQVGMRTVRIRRGPAPSTRGGVTEADAVVGHLREVGHVASGLIRNERQDVDNDLRACG